MSAKFGTLKDGEWHLTRATGIDGKHFHQCCGCGLTHEVKYRIYERVGNGLLRQLNTLVAHKVPKARPALADAGRSTASAIASQLRSRRG